MAKKKADGYLSNKESRAISKRNKKITDAYEKRHKRKNVPESEYTTTMKDPNNAVEFDHALFLSNTVTGLFLSRKPIVYASALIIPTLPPSNSMFILPLFTLLPSLNGITKPYVY